MSNKYRLPSTAEMADKAAGSLLAEATEKEWALAALVYAQVLPKGKRTDADGNSAIRRVTSKQYADRGIRGLSSHHTVAKYRDTWQAAIDLDLVRGDIRLGDEVALPPDTLLSEEGEQVSSWALLYPGDSRDGTEERHVPKSVARERAKAALLADPSIAEEVYAEDRGVREAVAKAADKRHQAAIAKGGKDIITCDLDPAEREIDALVSQADGVVEEAERRDGLRHMLKLAEAIDSEAKGWAEKWGGTGVPDEVEKIQQMGSHLRAAIARISTLAINTEVTK